MNHASNYLVLKGTLNQDKTAMLAEIDRGRARPEPASGPEEWRGL